MDQGARCVATATMVSPAHVLACRACLEACPSHSASNGCAALGGRPTGPRVVAVYLSTSVCSSAAQTVIRVSVHTAVRCSVCRAYQQACATLTFKALDLRSQQEPGFVGGGRCVCRLHRGGCVDDQHALRPDPHPCHHPSSTDHRPTREGLEQAEDSHRPASPDLMGTGIAPGHIISLSANCS